MKRGYVLSFLLGIAFVAIPPAGFCQTSGGGSTGGATTGGSGGRGGGPGVNTSPNNPSNPVGNRPSPIENRQQIPDFQRQIYVSGKVMLDDGTPPPEPILIERICNGNPRPEGYTDSKGRFSFQLGQNSAILADASTSTMDGRFGGGDRLASSGVPQQGSFGSPNGPSLMGCELRAQLAGFRSDTVQLYGKRALENPDVGTIILHRLAKVEGYTFSGTSTFAPKDAQKAYGKAREAIKKQKWDEAEKELLKATDTYPKYAVAWYDLGRIYQSQGKVDEAKKVFARSLQADAKFVSPYENLTKIAAYEANWQETEAVSTKAIRLNPYISHEVYYYNAVAHLQLKNFDAAEESAREALKLDPGHRNPKANEVLGIILANKQDFTGAAEQLKLYLATVPDAKDRDMVRKQLAEVERMQAAKNAEAK